MKSSSILADKKADNILAAFLSSLLNKKLIYILSRNEILYSSLCKKIVASLVRNFVPEKSRKSIWPLSFPFVSVVTNILDFSMAFFYPNLRTLLYTIGNGNLEFQTMKFRISNKEI
ncbi:MAG: hypothetical protein MSL09_09080 [Spirochaetia bacterium]|nr:hypothetical protein [Spirochaetia bacterium]